MDRISDAERRRIAELLAEGAPVWRLHKEINRSRHAIRRAVLALHRPPKREPRRAPLRLSLAGREEISRAWRQASRSGESPASWGAPRRRCAGMWRRTGGGIGTGLPPRTGARSGWRTVPSRPSWLYARGCARSAGSKLELRWSPQQIAGWLALAYPDDPEMRVSHETSYLSLFVQARGALRKELTRCLRTGRARRRPRGLTTRNGQGKIRGMVNISQRPAEAGDRAVPGHWEGDLLFGTRSSTVATLAGRKSRFVMLVGLPGSHTAGVVADALAGAITSLPGQLRRSRTWDQGKEMAGHARFSVATGVPACFCDPHSPWQRGSNENTNGLLRYYFPRSTDFRALTQRDLDNVAAELNGRPRQTGSDGSHHVRHWIRVAMTA